MESLSEVKKQLKHWEAGFIRQNNRRPGKDDIDQEASVKELYKKYSILKKKAPPTLSDVTSPPATTPTTDGSASVHVWGRELNKASNPIPATRRAAAAGSDGDEEEDLGPSFMSSLGKKLLSRASLTPNQSKKNDRTSWSRSNFDKKENLRSTPTTADKFEKPVNRMDTLSPQHSFPVEPFKSYPFVESPCQTSPKSRTVLRANKSCDSANAKEEEDTVKLPLSLQKKGVTSNFMRRAVAKPQHLGDSSAEISTADIDEPTQPFGGESPCRVGASGYFGGMDALQSPARIASQARARKRALSGMSVRNEEPAGKRSRGSMRSSPVRGHGMNRMEEDGDGEDEKETASDVQWRHDEGEQLMVNLDIEATSALPEMEPEPKSPENLKMKRKAPSGGSRPATNDNFIRLNMKVKTYKRKGSFKSGSAHKRMAWKQKMMNRSKAAGTKCFKCGEEGHWSKQCKGKGKNGPKGKVDWSGGHGQKKSSAVLSGLDDKEAVKMDDSAFPSMQEAVQMARGIKPSSITGDGLSVEEEEELMEMQVVREGFSQPAPPPPSQPLYSLNDDGSLPASPSEVYEALRIFGFTDFRPGQEKASMRILCGESTLVMLSTGAGKSLCYQLPAYIYAQNRQCITLVISPLVSLMEDQVTGLPPGVRGACLHTGMTKSQRERVKEEISDSKIHFLLVSPEALVGGSKSLGLGKLPPVAFACIDEVHCVSEWSHHFRPSYLRLCKVLREDYGVRCMLGLTATATLVTAASVAQHLGISDYRTATIRGAPIPKSLCLSVSRDECKEEALISLLQGERFASCDSIIIYCTRRQQTDRIATLLRTCLKDVKPPEPAQNDEDTALPVKGKRGKKAVKKTVKKAEILAECYHAGLSPAQRKRIQKAFMTGRLRIIVATVAFGMGLDKSDVRAVIHYDLPKTFESYVQEIGRSGRDGNVAHCHVFLSVKDLNEVRRHVYSNSVDRIAVKRLIQAVFPPCKCRRLHERLQKANKECDFEEDGIDYSNLNVDASQATANNDSSQATQNNDSSQATVNNDSSQATANNDSSQATQNNDSSQAKVNNDSSQAITNNDSSQATPNKDSSQATVNNDSSQATPNNADSSQATPNNDSSQATQNNDSSQATNGQSDTQESVSARMQRVCVGHERAVPIEGLVNRLDMKEEGISTLLCYLELHSQRWLENLPSVYSSCTLQCYGGPQQLLQTSKKCPPVAVAIAQAKRSGQAMTNPGQFQFNIVELSDSMGWSSGTVKNELKLLQWCFGVNGATKTGVMVEFSDLAFHFRSPGDLDDQEVDEMIEFLSERMETQERTELFQIQQFYNTLYSVSHKHGWMCADGADEVRSEKLKAQILQYFDRQPEMKNGQVTMLSFAMEMVAKQPGMMETVASCDYEASVRGDIRAFIHLYGSDHSLTGRTIARIFHGIGSPCFPVEVWGRVRRFWRCHLEVDFHLVRRLATQELTYSRK